MDLLDRQYQAEQEQVVRPVSCVDLEGGRQDALLRQRGDGSIALTDGVLPAQKVALRDELAERRVDRAVIPAEELMSYLSDLLPIDGHLMPGSERSPGDLRCSLTGGLGDGEGLSQAEVPD